MHLYTRWELNISVVQHFDKTAVSGLIKAWSSLQASRPNNDSENVCKYVRCVLYFLYGLNIYIAG